MRKLKMELEAQWKWGGESPKEPLGGKKAHSRNMKGWVEDR